MKKKICSNKNGSSYVWTSVFILVVVMIFSVVFTYVSLMITISRTREDTQRVLDSFVIENAEEIYQSVKNGNHTTLNNSYDEKFKNLIASELGLTRTATKMYSQTENNDIMFQYDNPVTTSIRNDVLELQTTFEIVIPIGFAGKKLFDFRIPLEVKSLYVMK